MLYLQSLPVFFAVAEEGSFSAAAKKCAVTQPTVSFHIDNLEKKLGCPLFNRTVKGVSLTVYGETLYNSTHKIEAILQDTENQIHAMVNGNAGHILLGASTIPAEYILPSLLGRFLQQYPGIRISVKTGDSGTVLAAHARSEYAIAIVGRKPPNTPCQPLWHDELLLVASPSMEETLPSNLDLSLLADIPMITREPSSGTRNVLADALQSHGLNLEQCNIILEVGGNEALKSAVLSGLGVAFISRWSVQKELAHKSLIAVPIPNLTIKRDFYGLVHLPLLPTCVARLWDFLLEDAQNTGAR
jgi:DNA-binding transcriptional LysR family regulator